MMDDGFICVMQCQQFIDLHNNQNNLIFFFRPFIFEFEEISSVKFDF